MSTVVFTGYRLQKMPFPEEEKNELYIRFIEQELKVIHRLVELGYTDFISGVAQGVDTWAAEDVLSPKKKNKFITLECAIPCPQQDNQWSADDQRRRKRILSHATSAILEVTVGFGVVVTHFIPP
ncbi:MAG: DUF1273 family protein [Clostridia bacterium]|nr:DUF1273 family protein [Clostridia bacterium]